MTNTSTLYDADHLALAELLSGYNTTVSSRSPAIYSTKELMEWLLHAPQDIRSLYALCAITVDGFAWLNNVDDHIPVSVFDSDLSCAEFIETACKVDLAEMIKRPELGDDRKITFDVAKTLVSRDVHFRVCDESYDDYGVEEGLCDEHTELLLYRYRYIGASVEQQREARSRQLAHSERLKRNFDREYEKCI